MQVEYIEYPFNPNCIDEFRAVIKANILKSEPISKLPSTNLGIVSLSCPYKGAEFALSGLTSSLSREIGAQFVEVSNDQLFSRLSGYEVVNAPPLRSQDSHRTSFTRNGRGKRMPIQSSAGGVQIIGLTLGVPREEEERKDDVAHAPYRMSL